MPLSSTSTMDQIIAGYVDNCGYDALTGTAAVTMARAFLQACRILILKMPAMSAEDRSSISLSPALIQEQLKQAQRFISLVGDGGVRHFDCTDIRGDQG